MAMVSGLQKNLKGKNMNASKKISTNKKPKPVGLLDPNFRYISASNTDITQTWRRFGWKPVEKPIGKPR